MVKKSKPAWPAWWERWYNKNWIPLGSELGSLWFELEDGTELIELETGEVFNITDDANATSS